MRNRIVHDYRGVDPEITFLIVTTEIPLLTASIENLIKKELQMGNFFEELEVARDSSWYRHVNFDKLL